MFRPRAVRRIAIGLGSTAFALIGVLAPGLPAQAKPTPAQVNSQINTLNNQIETLVEQYNLAKVKLDRDTAAQAALEKQIAPAQLVATLAHQQIGSLAAKIYMSGPDRTLQTMLASNDVSGMLDALGTLNEMASRQGKTINGAQTKLNDFKTKEAPITALVTKEKAQVATIAAKKKQIEGQLVVLQKLQDEAGGGGGGGGDSSGNVGSGPYTKAQLMPAACPSGGSGKGLIAAQKACSLVWRPGVTRYGDSGQKGWIMYHYARSSESDGYDCSGIVMVAWNAAGGGLSHSSYDQYSSTSRYISSSSKVKISKSNISVGDLVFYNGNGHVAIYVGGGWIVQAEHTGAPIMMSHIGFETPDGFGRVS
jgi:cell wall-associated NlpC family hydrolase